MQLRIREINRQSEVEITLVARRMRQTLVEVLGVEKGSSMYTMDWLYERVRWHLDPKETNGKVFLAEDFRGNILAHAMARVDHGTSHGYFSTVFVEPASRRAGLSHCNMMTDCDKALMAPTFG